MRFLVFKWKKEHKDWLFCDEIDPSFFDELHNVLLILTGLLYGMFKEEANGWEFKAVCVQNCLRENQSCFKNLKNALRYLDDNPKLDDEYEIAALNHLDAGRKNR